MRNRRLVKGVVAGVAGIALLLGGGTFALWFDTEDVPGGEIGSGELNLGLGTVGTWSNQAGVIADIATYLIVPGDVLTLDQPLEINAVGDTLVALLSVSTEGIAGTSALADALDIDIAVAVPPAGLTDNVDGTFDIVAATFVSPTTVTVGVTIVFPETTDGLPLAVDRSNWWNLTAQSELVDLSAIAFDLQQVT